MSEKIKSKRIVHLDEQMDKVAVVPHRLFDRICRTIGVSGAINHDLSESRELNGEYNRIHTEMVSMTNPDNVVFDYLIIEKFEDFITLEIDPHDFVVLDIMEDGISGKPQTRIAEGYAYLDRLHHDRSKRFYFSAFPSFLPAELFNELKGCEKHDTPSLMNELMRFLGYGSPNESN